MRHIENFKNFHKTDEGLSGLAIGGAMLLSSLFSGKANESPNSKPKVGTETVKKDGKTTTIQTRQFKNLTEDQRKALIAKKWIEIYQDTTWKEVIKNETKATKKVIDSIKFENKKGFESGDFHLTKSFKDIIDSTFENILSKGGLPVDIEIVSSTDKTPVNKLTLGKKLSSLGYTPDNAGLSKARAESLKNFIIKEGVTSDKLKLPEDSIHITNHIEQGGIDDPTARYVYVNISYVMPGDPGLENTNKREISDINSYWRLERTPIEGKKTWTESRPFESGKCPKW